MFEALSSVGATLAEHWIYWLVTVVLIVAAVIDGIQLKVPNWITFPFVISGWLYCVWANGWDGLGASLLGTIVGLALLLAGIGGLAFQGRLTDDRARGRADGA